MALIASDTPAAAAAVFTSNRVQAAPVQLSREHLRKSRGQVRAIIVNAGNANCATGPRGRDAARATAEEAARALGCRPVEVLVCSTGVIGVPLRVGKILGAVPGLVRRRLAAAAAWEQVMRAILTTDTRPKWAAARCRIAGKAVRILGCAKGAGMIAPHLATMLAFVVTDAGAAPARLQRMLRDVAGRTFNRITIDGDTSTNDTLALLANGAAGAILGAPGASRDTAEFVAALESVCRSLALAIVADGEGAQRVVEIEVRGASTPRAAEQIARAIATSPLVKTALAGADPNWGRILAAAGRAGVAFDPERAEVWLAGVKVYGRPQAVRGSAPGKRGCAPLPFDERAVHQRMLRNYISIVLDLEGSLRRGSGRSARHSARIWTCDFTSQYVDINASYRT